VSVCPFARLSQVGVLQKRLNVKSRKQRHTIAQGVYSFLMPKISAKLKRGHSQRRRQMEVGCVKCRCGIGANWRLSTRSVANLARSQIRHTEHPPYLLQHGRRDAVRRAGLSATDDPCCQRWNRSTVHAHSTTNQIPRRSVSRVLRNFRSCSR